MTENDLLKVKVERERAIIGLLNALRDLVLDARDLMRKEATKRP